MFLREHVMLLWIIEGDRYMRAHKGTCYIYEAFGAFQQYRGIPPEGTFHRVKSFLLQLEGLFRLLPSTIRRDDQSIVASVVSLLQEHENESALLQACMDASILHGGERRASRGGKGDGGDNLEMSQGTSMWTLYVAQGMSRVGLQIQKELLDEKIINYFIEWCETPSPKSPAVAYEDVCFVYTDGTDSSMTRVGRSPNNNIYLVVPHGLCDPVLEAVMEEVETFYAQTFWCNVDVFRCNQAALALAKRGENVDRCFFGISPGGVGQSLYSAHLKAQYGHNFEYFDPAVWYHDEELRKQVEQFAGCIILTGQEAPETSKRMRADLFKKMQSGDGIAGRKPYGMVTRMLEVVGWKRMELNRMVTFPGITEVSFNSVFRRALVWKAKARFYDRKFLTDNYPDASADGIFPRNPALKRFLTSKPAALAGLRLQHGFEMKHSKSDCEAMIENYAALGGDGGLTEDTLRLACGLPVRSRREDITAGIPVFKESSSQDGAGLPDSDLRIVYVALMEDMLAKGRDFMSFFQFKHFTLPHGSPNLDRESLWKRLKESSLCSAIEDKGKLKNCLVPCIRSKNPLRSLISLLPRAALPSLQESYDRSGLKRYLHGHASRSLNVSVLLEALTSLLPKRTSRGRPQSAELQRQGRIEGTINKIKAGEDLANRLCDKLFTLCKGTSDDEQSRKRLRRKGSAESSQQGEEDYPTRVVQYHYTFGTLIRTRAQAETPSAQGCSRRVLRVLLPHTIDLDIENCMFTLLHQIALRLNIDQDIPQRIHATMVALATRRDGVIRDDLQMDIRTGKEVLAMVMNGGAVPASLEKNTFMEGVQEYARFMRWLAQTELPDVFTQCQSDVRRRNPDVSTMFFMWTAVEDAIIESWLRYIRKFKFAHCSLHFDGIRISRGGIQMSVEDFCIASADHIHTETGFAVRIREKKHYYLTELFAHVSTSTGKSSLQDVLRRRGNCIPAALFNLEVKQEEILAVLSETGEHSDMTFHLRGTRSYGSVASLLNIQLIGEVGLACEDGAKYLVHSEGKGIPHCVAVSVSVGGDEVQVLDGEQKYLLSKKAFLNCGQEALDRLTVVCFKVLSMGENANWPFPESQIASKALLELQASGEGAYFQSENVLTLPCRANTLSENESDSGEMEEAEDTHGKGRRLPKGQLDEAEESSTVVVGDKILQIMERETRDFLSRCRSGQIRAVNNAMRCRLCPWRSFKGQRADRLVNHVLRHHTERRQYCCSGTKQLKIVLALYDFHVLRREEPADLLSQSASLLSRWVQPPLSATANSIDKEIRLIFTKAGPMYQNAATVVRQHLVRRARNLMYSRGFAEMLARECLANHAKMRSVHARLALNISERGSKMAGLLPTNTRHWWPMVEDIFASPHMTRVYGNLLRECYEHQEFEILSIDATMRSAASLVGQARSSSSAFQRANAAFDDSIALRRVLTIRGVTGAVLGMVPIKRENTLDICAALLGLLNEDMRKQVKFIATDDPSRVMVEAFKGIFPQLRCLVLDSTHLAMVYEYSTWRKRTDGSSWLRKIMWKFNVVDSSTPCDAWGCFYDGTTLQPLSREEEHLRSYIREASMPITRAKAVLARLQLSSPFRDRVEFVESIAALVSLFPEECQRKSPGPNKPVKEILYAATQPSRSEWFFNNLRMLHSGHILNRSLVAVGTTSNEALHREINNWFRQTQTMHQPTFRLKLRILTISKLISHNAALYAPTVRQLNQSVVLSRAVCRDIWAPLEWKQWCSAKCQRNRIGKATLPYCEMRKLHESRLREWMAKRPAKGSKNGGKPKKRTVFTLERKDGLVRAGKRIRKKSSPNDIL